MRSTHHRCLVVDVDDHAPVDVLGFAGGLPHDGCVFFDPPTEDAIETEHAPGDHGSDRAVASASRLHHACVVGDRLDRFDRLELLVRLDRYVRVVALGTHRAQGTEWIDALCRVSTTTTVVTPTVGDVWGGHGVGRVGAAMRSSLCGRPLIRFDAPLSIGPHPTESGVVEVVEVDGRRIRIEFDDGIVLDTRTRWGGEWHLYREHDRWSRPTTAARVVVEVPGRVAVCFGNASIETYRRPDARRHPLLGGAGPDVRSPRFDVDAAVDRISAAVRHDVSVLDVLGDQHLVTGLGNVVRSETLWAMALDPRTASVELDDEDWRQLLETARRLSTDAPERLEAYGRLGQICRRCHGTIGCADDGDDRPVYWCASCQTTLDDPRAGATIDERPTDVRFLDEAREARRRVQIFDDLREFG